MSSLSPYSSLSIEVIPYIQSVRFVEIYAIGLVAIVVSAWFVSSVYIYLKYSPGALCVPSYRIPLFKNIYFPIPLWCSMHYMTRVLGGRGDGVVFRAS